MGDVSAKDVMALRERTGVSMMMCKKALVEAKGDAEKAVEILRKKGEAKAADKSARSTSEGAIAIAVDHGKAAIVSVLCETDFVARNEDFLALAQQIAETVLRKGIDAREEAEALVKEKIVQMGENLQLGAAELVSSEVIGAYVHANKKIGVVIGLRGGSEEKAKDVAMHAAAMNPSYVSPDELDDTLISKEKEIWKEQLRNERKPDDVIEKILVGKEKKFREENALITQIFVKDPSLQIGSYLGDAKVSAYIRVAI